MRTRWSIVLVVVAAVLALSLTFGAGVASALFWFERNAVSVTPGPEVVAANEAVPEELKGQFKTFWDTWAIVSKEFYGRPVDNQEMVYGATRGMVQALGDDYTAFVTPEENKLIHDHMQGRFEGIGVYVELKESHLTVISPIEGSPAQKAGIRAGDVIMRVDGRDITGLAVDAAVALIKGPKGTDVKLEIARAGEEGLLEFSITRAEINAPSVFAKEVDDRVAFLRIEMFGDKTPEDFDKELSSVLEKKPRGLVLDLRDNGGGYVDGALQVLGRLMPQGVAYYEDAGPGTGDPQPHQVKNGGVKAYDLPVVVLVNGGTASASEIVAGALQDSKRAVLFGEKTFGKGSVQNVHELESGASVRVTAAHWLTPNKHEINGVGLDPDVVVTISQEELEAGADPQLDAAIAHLLAEPS